MKSNMVKFGYINQFIKRKLDFYLLLFKLLKNELENRHQHLICTCTRILIFFLQKFTNLLKIYYKFTFYKYKLETLN